MRLALLQLREALDGKSREQIIRFFVQRHAHHLTVALDGSRRPRLAETTKTTFDLSKSLRGGAQRNVISFMSILEEYLWQPSP